jgi:hypothetical protein
MSVNNSDKIFVNGAWIERDFYEENVNEARSTNWSKVKIGVKEEHRHCMICGMAIGVSNIYAFKSPIGWLCTYCHKNFIEMIVTD